MPRYATKAGLPPTRSPHMLTASAAGPDDDRLAEDEDPDLASVDDDELDDPVDDDRLSDSLGDPP